MRFRRRAVLLRGTYSLYREIGETPDGMIFRYSARLGSLGWLFTVPLIAVALAGAWDVLFIDRNSIGVESKIAAFIGVGFFGCVGLFFLGMLIVSLWSHRELVVSPKERRLLWRSRTPIREHLIERSAGKIRGLTFEVEPRVNIGFAGIDLGDGQWLDLGQGLPDEAQALVRRLSLLLEVPIVGGVPARRPGSGVKRLWGLVSVLPPVLLSVMISGSVTLILADRIPKWLAILAGIATTFSILGTISALGVLIRRIRPR